MPKKGEKMIANHIHDALAQVRKMQELVLAKRNFRGYSGTARAIGGVIALCGATFIYLMQIPKTPESHLIVWGTVLCLSLAVNYGALIWWFLHDREAARDINKLLPAIDALPALAAGAILTFALISHQHYDLLFGVWMLLYGLVHVSYRMSLPGENYIVGLFYILCGTVCLFTFNDFYNPWPMGVVFFAGEIAGGYVFNKNK
ncbi:MAG TPA: hypothetical protein DCZ94_01560 [Lentisphaeria bacterium]|nr:MAG: hypothetical protein A2X48_21440 [Lentisphaerae bacterium GWF2_49_21]HBC85618.1 hypothetical protein [Lentisphaeria bacterium]